MSELTEDVNWIATIASAVLAFLLGWVWYSPKPFGTKWAEGVGIKVDGSKLSTPAMVLQLVGTFLFTCIVAITAASNALLTAILVFLAIVCLMVASGLFCQKSRHAITTKGGFIVAMAMIMIICQSVFQAPPANGRSQWGNTSIFSLTGKLPCGA